jgi:hypothetical protein
MSKPLYRWIPLALIIGVLGLAAPATALSEREAPHSQDALILATRLTTGPRIDHRLVAELDSVLARARRLHPMFDSISAFPDFEWTQLLVKPTADVAAHWQQGELHVGDQRLDSLADSFHLIRASEMFPKSSASRSLDPWCLLTFAEPLNMPVLARLYARSPAILAAKPSHMGGEGDNIWAIKNGAGWELVFSRGWDDCPAGCIHHRSLFVQIDSAGRGVGSPTWPSPAARLPGRYAASLFKDGNALFNAFQDADWTLRRHAIEVAWRFSSFDYPWLIEDVAGSRGRIFPWRAMQAGVRDRRGDVITLIRARLSDTEPQVRLAARLALRKLASAPQ